MKNLALGFTIASLGLLGAILMFPSFGSDRDASTRWLQGLWTGEDTNGFFPGDMMSIKLTTNGYGVVLTLDHNVVIPGTFTYTLSRDRITFLTNDSPWLTGTLRYDTSANVLVYQESAKVAVALRRTQGPVLLLRDTNEVRNAMLGSMVGATNYHDVMTRLGRFIGTLTNDVGAIQEKSAAQKKAQQNGAANRSQPIRSETNRTSSAAGSRR